MSSGMYEAYTDLAGAIVREEIKQYSKAMAALRSWKAKLKIAQTSNSNTWGDRS